MKIIVIVIYAKKKQKLIFKVSVFLLLYINYTTSIIQKINIKKDRTPPTIKSVIPSGSKKARKFVNDITAPPNINIHTDTIKATLNFFSVVIVTLLLSFN